MTAARVNRTPTYNDLEIVRLAYRAMGEIQDAGRFGDRKVFIGSLWTRMVAIEAHTGGTLTEGATIEHFKAWLLRSRLLTVDGTEYGARLIVLCRADLVAAMDPALVAASETTTDGASFHFVIDPEVASGDYAARAPRRVVASILASGRVGRVGASHRAA